MSKPKHPLFRNKNRVFYAALAFISLLVSVALPLVSPYLTESAFADRPISTADMSIGGLYNKDDGNKFRNPTQPQWATMSCMGSITRMALSDDLIQRALRVPNFTGLSAGDRSDAYDTLFADFTIGAGSGSSNGTTGGRGLIDSERRAYYDYIKANHNQEVPVLSWHKAGQTSPGSTASCGTSDPQSGHFILLPVHSRDDSNNSGNADTWIACQFWQREDADSTKNRVSSCNATRYKANLGPDLYNINTSVGTAEFFRTAIAKNNGLAFAEGVTVNNFVVKGFASAAGPVVSGNIAYGEFVDAATIKVTSKLNGNDLKETYVDPAWDGRHIYFLAESEGVPVRQEMTYTAKGGQPTDNPLTDPGARRGIPFIYIAGQAPNINFDGGRTMANFGNGINSPLTSAINYYDYQASGAVVCHGGCPSNGLPTPADINNSLSKINASVWFYRDETTQTIIPVFTDGDTNEENYIGLYNYNKGLDQYVLPGIGCEQISMLKLDGGVSSMLAASWTMFPPGTNCIATAGWNEKVRVKVSSDPAGYKKALEAQAANASIISEADDAGKVTCDASISSPITWIMCPIATAATAAVDGLDSIVNEILTVNVNTYFGNDKTGKALYDVWKNLRTVAMAVIVVAALFMVIAQASGWEIMSALTFRKAMPGFVVAVILLGIWWPVGKALITFGDVATYGVRHLIYAPFDNVAVFKLDGKDGTGGTTAVLALFGGPYLLALGIFATATFAVTAFFAILIGCVILMLRLAVIIGLQTTSAIFIPFYAIPNMKGVWTFFWGGFTKAIWLGPVLAGAIAIARVLAGIFYTVADSTENKLMKFAFIVMAIILYFGVYAILAEIVSSVGGLAATLAGRVNDRSRGIFDRMKNTRAKAPGERFKRLKHGEFFNDTFLTNKRRRGPLGAIGRFGDRMGERVGLGAKNNFGFGQKGKAADFFHMDGQLDEILRTNAPLRALGLNDDNANAVLALSGGSLRGARDAIKDINAGRVRNGQAEWTAEEQQRIEQTITPFLGDRKFAAAAARNMMQNKARGVSAGDAVSVHKGMDRIAEGNGYMASQLKSSIDYFGRAGGRVDLGGEWSTIRDGNGQFTGRAAQIQAAAPISDEEVTAHAMMLDGVERTDVSSLMRSHTATVTQAASTVKFLLDKKNKVSFEMREEGAKLALELQKANSSGMGPASNRDVINNLMKDLDVDLSGQRGKTVATQLAEKVTSSKTLLSGEKLWAMARAYDQEMPSNAAIQQQGVTMAQLQQQQQQQNNN